MNVSDVACRAARSIESYTKRNAPTILTTAGVVGMIGTTVLVAKATIKAKPKAETMKQELYTVENREITDEYSKKTQATDYGRIWISGAETMAKLYGPSVILGTASIFCIVSAHGMMKQRQAALVAAYATLDQGFRTYRARIKEELGTERELDIYRGIKNKRTVDDDEGKPCVIDEYYEDNKIPSPYARFFDETSKSWSKTPEYNSMFLNTVQNWANDRLRAYGYIFLNEVYEELGLPRTQAGQVVGWKLKQDGGVDGYVDFGIYDINDECNRAFVNGLEHTILLDFNVDGPIEI